MLRSMKSDVMLDILTVATLRVVVPPVVVTTPHTPELDAAKTSAPRVLTTLLLVALLEPMYKVVLPLLTIAVESSEPCATTTAATAELDAL